MLRVDVIGTVRKRQNHSGVFSEAPCNLAGFTGVDEPKRELAEMYYIEHKRESRKFLPFIGGVSLATPANNHYEVFR